MRYTRCVEDMRHVREIGLVIMRVSGQIHFHTFPPTNPQSTQLIRNIPRLPSICLYMLIEFYIVKEKGKNPMEHKAQQHSLLYFSDCFAFSSLFGHIIIFIVHFANDFLLSYPYSHHHRISLYTCRPRSPTSLSLSRKMLLGV